MNNQNTLIHLEDLGETTQVQVNGYGKELIELIARALINSPELKQITEMALIEAYAYEFKQQQQPANEEAALLEMLKGLKIGLS